MRRGLMVVSWLGAGLAVVGFFLPWAFLDVQGGRIAKTLGDIQQIVPHQTLSEKLSRVVISIKQGTETVTGTLPDLATIPTRVRGVEIPTLAHRPDAKLALAVVELLTGDRQLGAKSYIVYLVPGIALLCGLLISVLPQNRVAYSLISALCGVIAGVGFWKLLTAQTDSLIAQITIGPGLWLSCWAYVGLAVAAMAGGLIAHRPPSQHP